MIQVYLTDNYGGFQISGNFEDLNQFYDDLGSVVGFKESQDDNIELQCLLILGLMYEVRHAYQGDRIIKMSNGALRSNKEDKFPCNVRFAFNYLLADFLADYIILRHQLFPVKKSTYGIKYEDLMSAHYRIVNVFAQTVEQLTAVLTPIQSNKVKRYLSEETNRNFTIYHGAWLEVISADHIRMAPKQRKQKLMSCISALCEPYSYGDFYDMQRDINEYAKRKQCAVKDVHLSGDLNYNNIQW